MEISTQSQFLDMSTDDLIRLQKKLNELQRKFEAKGADKARSIIQSNLIDCTDPREKRDDNYWEGYDAGLRACRNLIRDQLVFDKKSK